MMPDDVDDDTLTANSITLDLAATFMLGDD
jgi:hypothetical protein